MHFRSASLALSELRSIPLLSRLPNSQLEHLCKTLRTIHLSEGDQLCHQGQQADRFFMVRSGQIRQFRVSMEGNERVVDIVQPGQLFAENLLLLENPSYPFSADALTDSELLMFEAGEFVEILGSSITTCLNLMSSMAAQIRHYIEQVDFLTMQNANFRVVNYLLKQVPGNHRDIGPYTFHLSAPKSVIASWLSIQPETLSRQLASLKARNLIQVKGKMITINDVCQLRQMVA